MKIILYFFILIFLFSNKIINCGNSTCFEYSCDECLTSEYGTCIKCRDEFRLVDGTCPCSDINCALCETGLAGLHICELCKNGYFNFNKDCYCDITDCEHCTENSCLICKTGYYYDSSSNSCLKQEEENKLVCYDPNCDACYSSQKGGCDTCKDGYSFDKGECFELPKPDQNNNCPQGFYLKDNNCERICDGVDCSTKNFYYFLCDINECLVCTNNVLQIFSECDNSKNCTMDGCLNCITNDECLICSQGYYLLYGTCIKCTEGCSICANDDICIYCLSGYKLNSNKKCVLTQEFDFNVKKYQKYKNNLIKINYPDEIINDIDIDNDEILDCDQNCLKCYDNSGICKECNKLYILEDNTCVKHCTDTNCLNCSLVGENEQCTACKENYILKNFKCAYNCTINNCLSCTFEDNNEICDKCDINYDLDDSGKKCKAKINYVSIVFAILGILIIIISIISFWLYRRNRRDYRTRIINMRYTQDINNVNVYGRNNGLDNSGRIEINKEEIADEYENQKRKKEKGDQMCQFCKKKPGKFKCDCGCVVCKEHSILKNMEGEGENYKVCFCCNKIVKKVNPIKYNCHICMQKKISVAHFKCECALEVCKDCYIKCKMGSNKCPGCRANI